MVCDMVPLLSLTETVLTLRVVGFDLDWPRWWR